MRRPMEVAVKAVHSRLFSSLDSTWRFRPGNAPNTTLIDFSVEFEVKNLLAAQAMDVFFDEVALQQVMNKRGTGVEMETARHTERAREKGMTYVLLTNRKHVYRTVRRKSRRAAPAIPLSAGCGHEFWWFPCDRIVL